MIMLPQKENCKPDMHSKYNGCCMCCTACNWDKHVCHFCGENLNHDSTKGNGDRHWLSDCRPDLIDGSYWTDRGTVPDSEKGEPYKDGPMV